MQKVKKIPQRQCVGAVPSGIKGICCGSSRPRRGEIVLDATGKKSGRGVYVCPDPECLRKARKSRGLERAWRRPSRRRYTMGWRPGWGSNGAYFINDRPCQKAGRVEIGEEPVGSAARSKHARVILVASDAAAGSVRRAYAFAQTGACLCLTIPADKDALGRALAAAAAPWRLSPTWLCRRHREKAGSHGSGAL